MPDEGLYRTAKNGAPLTGTRPFDVEAACQFTLRC